MERFTASAELYLGAANLAGYLAGALGARAVAARFGAIATLQAAMLLTAASLLACAFHLGFAWFFVWHFVSGWTGGVLMALAAPTVISAIPAERRAIAGGVIFTGVGLGIAASGPLVPLSMWWSLVETWFGPRRYRIRADHPDVDVLAGEPIRRWGLTGVSDRARIYGPASPLIPTVTDNRYRTEIRPSIVMVRTSKSEAPLIKSSNVTLPSLERRRRVGIESLQRTFTSTSLENRPHLRQNPKLEVAPLLAVARAGISSDLRAIWR